MNDEETTSVSKGVFIFKNGFKSKLKSKGSRPKKQDKLNDDDGLFSDNLWYQTYKNLWDSLEVEIEELNNEMFASVLHNLVSYIESTYKLPVNEVPSAALLTGINMPDHRAQFKALTTQIRQQITPHVVCLYSSDCQTLKCLMEHMIGQFININENTKLEDEEIETEETTTTLKKSQFNFSLLQAWYENLYNCKQTKQMVVIIPDFESFNSKVLQDFVQICSSYINILPFVLVFGIATSLNQLHTTFPYHVLSKINVQVFHSQPSTVYLNNILEKIFFTLTCPFQLGGKVFNLFTDIFLFYDLSVSGFIKNIKYAMLEHFCYGNAKSLCVSGKKEIKHTLENFTHEDYENVRQLLSFRRLVEGESYENRIKLLTDDDFLKNVVLEETDKLRKYIRRFHFFLRYLYILVWDLPKAPLGKQLRELYAIATTSNITDTPEYKKCFEFLNFQSKEQLSSKLSTIIQLISAIINNNCTKQNNLQTVLDNLNIFLNNMNLIDTVDDEEEIIEDKMIDDNVISGQLDRRQLKEKLLGLSKNSKPLNRYEKLRSDLLNYLSDTFKVYLVEPSSFHFHEIYFFNDISIQNRIIGVHRASIHNALNDPHDYLQCKCCTIPNNAVIKATMPDISIIYKLHLECGKMINLYDWLQAYLSIIDPISDDEDESKRRVKPELQARFTQAVAELEFLGFIKSSKRKTDHVTRLTWEG